jgi:hypothetical protein
MPAAIEAEGEEHPTAEAEPAVSEESWAANDDVPAAPEPAPEPVAETPEPVPVPEAASLPEPEPAPEPEPPAPVTRDYEVVNQPPAQPKRGFWKRLVE